jgi:hypothetical protein
MVGTETPLINQLTHLFTPQLALTGGARVDVQPSAMYELEMGPKNSGDVYYTLTSGMSAELPRDAASSKLVAPGDGSGATLDMQMTRDRDIEVASIFPSSSTLDLTVIADGAVEMNSRS